MFNLPSQTMTFGNALNHVFKLWWATLLPLLPLSIVAGLLNSWPVYAQHWLDIETHKTLFFSLGAIATLINLIPSNAIFAKLWYTIHQQPLTYSQSLAISLVKFPRTLGWLILLLSLGGIILLLMNYAGEGNTPMGMTLGSIALLMLSFFIIFGIYTLCVLPLIIFEDQPVITAIQNSFRLTQHQWWFGAGLVVAVFACSRLVVFSLKLLLGKVGVVLASCLMLPLNISMVIIFYEHLKLRVKQNDR